MNPIDKITDPTFTSSTKGLLTLFCIGLFHVVIGVNLTNAKIAIPWLPTVNFENTERLVYIYWLLVLFTSYRYTLHHLPLIRKYFFLSLGKFLKISRSSERFIRTYIYSQEISYQVVIKEEPKPFPCVKVEHYDHGDSGWEKMVCFEFRFDKDFRFLGIVADENPTYSIEGLAFNKNEHKSSWGLKSFTSEHGEHYLESSMINSIFLKYKVRFEVLKVYFRTISSSREAFDLLVPLLLNIFLFIAWVVKEFYQVY
ncbi:hypothetical protein [Aliivibrio fischeri]|uniref:hypothetical protein n=1 Tax=Aliivibrio fischeri TaxID=668 RepID=UPI0012DA2809|nr:hypothetical protein [Aliivibrio fischeri]MUL11531.1 hypothetical protein [Aliivibrio fischeri]MUL15541.1 hypothetical protein [Aliivibrio fischeri]